MMDFSPVSKPLTLFGLLIKKMAYLMIDLDKFLKNKGNWKCESYKGSSLQ